MDATLDDRIEALHDCARFGEAEDVSSLLAGGVPVDAVDQTGRTALFCAAANGHLLVLQLLLTHGANARHANNDGNTALHWACLNGHADAVGLLLAAGASASALNAAQRTPVDEALQNGAEAVLQRIYDATGGGGVSDPAMDGEDEGDEVAATTDEPLMPLD